MGQPGAVIIAFVSDKYLGLIFQPPEGGGVQNPVAIALESGAIFGLFFLDKLALW